MESCRANAAARRADRHPRPCHGRDGLRDEAARRPGAPPPAHRRPGAREPRARRTDRALPRRQPRLGRNTTVTWLVLTVVLGIAAIGGVVYRTGAPPGHRAPALGVTAIAAGIWI